MTPKFKSYQGLGYGDLLKYQEALKVFIEFLADEVEDWMLDYADEVRKHIMSVEHEFEQETTQEYIEKKNWENDEIANIDYEMEDWK